MMETIQNGRSEVGATGLFDCEWEECHALFPVRVLAGAAGRYLRDIGLQLFQRNGVPVFGLRPFVFSAGAWMERFQNLDVPNLRLPRR